MDSCRKSREITTSSFSVFSTRSSGRGSDCSTRYSRPHRPQGSDVARSAALRPELGEEDTELGTIACGFPFECQSDPRAQSETLWEAGGRQRASREVYQPLLGDPRCRGGEGCAAGSQQGRLSFIGDGAVSAERSDIYRQEGSGFYGPKSASDLCQDNSRASVRY